MLPTHLQASHRHCRASRLPASIDCPSLGICCLFRTRCVLKTLCLSPLIAPACSHAHLEGAWGRRSSSCRFGSTGQGRAVAVSSGTGTQGWAEWQGQSWGMHMWGMHLPAHSASVTAGMASMAAAACGCLAHARVAGGPTACAPAAAPELSSASISSAAAIVTRALLAAGMAVLTGQRCAWLRKGRGVCASACDLAASICARSSCC